MSVGYEPGESEKLLLKSKGTPGFTAPEQISGIQQCFPADVFALGKLLVVVIFEWQFGLSLLLSSKTLVKLNKLEPLEDLLNLIRRMLRVKMIKHILTNYR